MQKFIYVTTKEERDKLIQIGYNLLKSDEKNSVYIFVYRPMINFDLMGIKAYTLSDTLTF